MLSHGNLTKKSCHANHLLMFRRTTLPTCWVLYNLVNSTIWLNTWQQVYQCLVQLYFVTGQQKYAMNNMHDNHARHGMHIPCPLPSCWILCNMANSARVTLTLVDWCNVICGVEKVAFMSGVIIWFSYKKSDTATKIVTIAKKRKVLKQTQCVGFSVWNYRRTRMNFRLLLFTFEPKGTHSRPRDPLVRKSQFEMGLVQGTQTFYAS